MALLKVLRVWVCLWAIVSSIPAAFGGNENDCLLLFKKLLPNPEIAKYIQKIDNSKLEKEVLVKIFTDALNLKFEKSELDALVTGLNDLEKDPGEEILHTFVIYANTLRAKNKLDALLKMNALNDSEPESRIFKKFNSLHRKLEKKVQKQYQKNVKKLTKEHPEKTAEEIDELAKIEAKNFQTQYQDLLYGCRSNSWTPQRKTAAKAFKNFSVGIGFVSGTTAYSYHNWDKEKDSKWFGILAYETIWGMFTSKIRSKIISNPATTYVGKGAQKYMFSRLTGAADMIIYDQLFGVTDARTLEKYNELMKDPKKKEAILKLLAYYDQNEERIFNRVKSGLLEYLRKSPMSFGLEESPETKVEGVDWNNLTKEDLEKKEVQDMLMAAIAAETYETEASGYLKTGNVGVDRYVFRAGYGAIMLPRDIASNIFMYNILCMGSMNPRWALVKAVGFFFIERTVMDQIFFYSRRQMVNQ